MCIRSRHKTQKYSEVVVKMQLAAESFAHRLMIGNHEGGDGKTSILRNVLPIPYSTLQLRIYAVRNHIQA